MARSIQSAPRRVFRNDVLASFPLRTVPSLKAEVRQAVGHAAINRSLPRTVRGGIAYALGLVRSRYESNIDPDDDRSFHCAEHTTGVIRRTGELLRAMGAAEREYQLGLLAAAFHDTVQRRAPATTPDGKVLRRPFTGRNEIDSAAEAVAWMRQAGGAFGAAEYDLVTRAILATVPGWDAENGTVSQPHLTADAPATVRAVALADLGVAGMDGEAFLVAGDRLFREENLDIGRALRRCATRADLGAATLEGYKARMQAWSRSQAGFAARPPRPPGTGTGRPQRLRRRGRAGPVRRFPGGDRRHRSGRQGSGAPVALGSCAGHGLLHPRLIRGLGREACFTSLTPEILSVRLADLLAARASDHLSAALEGDPEGLRAVEREAERLLETEDIPLV